VIDDQRRLVHQLWQVIASHLRGDFVRRYVEVPNGRRYDRLTSAAGYPPDKTYHQTVKGWSGRSTPGARRRHHHRPACSEGMG
jgi:hypothetical protein